MDTHFRNFVIQTSTIFFSECYPSEVILLWTYIASSGQVSGKWGTFGDSLKFNGNDLTKVYLSFVVERGRESSPSVNASPSVFFPVPGNLCLLHDYQLKALHREVFRDRKCPWRKIKYCLGCRKSTEVNSCCSRAHPKPDNFPPYLPSPPSISYSILKGRAASQSPASWRQGWNGLVIICLCLQKASRLDSNTKEDKITFLFPGN